MVRTYKGWRSTAAYRKREMKWLLTIYNQKDAEQTCRVYDAEHYPGVLSDAVFRTKGQALQLINSVRKDPRWRAMHGKHPFKVKWLSRNAPYGWGWITGVALPSNPFGRSVNCILHEMAHATSCHAHSPNFCRVHVHLVRHFMGWEFGDRLERQYRRTGALPPLKRSK